MFTLFLHLTSIFALMFLTQCQNKRVAVCQKHKLFNDIHNKEIYDVKILNREKVVFKSKETINFQANDQIEYVCIFQSDINQLEDSLNFYKIYYLNQNETNTIASIISYLLPIFFILVFSASIITIFFLLRDQNFNDSQRLIYLILIIFVPIMGCIIYLLKRRDFKK